VTTLAAADRTDDSLSRFRAAVTAIRLACLAFAAAIAAPAASNDHWRLALVGLGLVVVHAARILAPLHGRGRAIDLVAVAGSLAIHVAAVLATGGWDSPYVFPLLGVVAIAGFARGLREGIPTAIAVAAVISAASWAGWFDVTWSFTAARQWSLEVVMVAGVAGYARRVIGDAESNKSEAMLWVQQLTDANVLLSSLHRVAQALPAELDLDGVLDQTIRTLRDHLRYDAAAIMLRNQLGEPSEWRVGRFEGIDGDVLDSTVLRSGPARALHRLAPVRVDLGSEGTGPPAGLRSQARCGVYAPLLARNELVGLLAIEFDDEEPAKADRALELARGLSEPAGLGIDNARWFARLRLVGADEERTRIAHDLHDGVGQTLAYLGFELERVTRGVDDTALSQELTRLRGDLRTALSEVRETLFDLKSDVSDEIDVGAALARCCARVTERGEVKVAFEGDANGRLPRRVEHELWRIGQEAVLAAERRWNASSIAVRWWTDGRAAELELAHDGFAEQGRRRGDAMEVATLQDRADALGAELTVSKAFDGRQVLRLHLRPT
jgi:signal transduction histidine kinase